MARNRLRPPANSRSSQLSCKMREQPCPTPWLQPWERPCGGDTQLSFAQISDPHKMRDDKWLLV